jgi:hypothetical protein
VVELPLLAEVLLPDALLPADAVAEPLVELPSTPICCKALAIAPNSPPPWGGGGKAWSAASPLALLVALLAFWEMPPDCVSQA